MAEAPQRYCSNCGHELSPEDQFCPNCGTPVHRAARVPTPEADVPVPPPPQQQGAGASAPPPQQAGAPQQPWPRRHPIAFGCLSLIVLLVLLAVLIPGGGGGGGGGGDVAEQQEQPRQEQAQNQDQGQQQGQQEQQAERKPRPQPEYRAGQTAKVGNVEWTVTDAYLTNQLRSNFGTQKRGRFVVADFTFTNNRPEEVTLDPELHMILRDTRGREFGTDTDAWEFVPTRLNLFLQPVNPGISQDGRVIYEVPPDAEGFVLILDDVEFLEDKTARYDLGALPTRAYVR
jgi:hypothetical protein